MANLADSPARGREPRREKLAGLLRGRWGPILLSFASAGSGAILGAVVQSWSITPLRLAAISAGTLSVLAIGLSAAAAARDSDDWLSQDGTWPDESMDRAYMADHQTALIDHIRSLGQGITYKRICQVDQVSEPLQSMGTREMFQHLTDMQRLRDEGAQRVVIKFAEKKFPYKFLIVDREGLVLQLQELSSEGRLKIWGELIIRDPTGHFINPFLAIWEDMDDSPRTRTITMKDLSPA